MKQLTVGQEEVLRNIIDTYELHEAETVTVVDIARNSGISMGLAGRLMHELQDLGLVETNVEGVVVSADNNGYYP
jgi:predicted transcriptional regulator